MITKITLITSHKSLMHLYAKHVRLPEFWRNREMIWQFSKHESEDVKFHTYFRGMATCAIRQWASAYLTKMSKINKNIAKERSDGQ